ncbi:MAG: hypothetical protein JWO02_1666, partial [Solirubrobacterales bacterium]|nr:hypothetical protein [Solirubrobacterales bacterium]
KPATAASPSSRATKPAPAGGVRPKPKPKAQPQVTPKPTAAAAKVEPKPAAAPQLDQPLAEYDDMTPYEITELLDHLPAEKLDAVERYERANENRDLVLVAIVKQRDLPDPPH